MIIGLDRNSDYAVIMKNHSLLVVLMLFQFSILSAQDKVVEVLENRLAKEASPYLRQHAKNPVNWYPWGKGAFDKAKKENKPILLSIGYSTCHWCHVMERETFEDKKIAKFLNENFVSIKLDREERPDIDKIYMTSYSVMSGQNGGWPLNVFLTPDLKMFYGGTYFPARNKGQQVGFESVLQQLDEAWKNDNKGVLQTADGLNKHMTTALSARVADTEVVPRTVLDKATEQMMSNADKENGGWGDQSKFPMPSHLRFLLLSWRHSGDVELLDFVKLTANRIIQGGIHDHIGGGFHRYTVDNQWLVPHFEKMLYDQAQLLEVFLDLYQITNDDKYKLAAQSVADYIVSNLQSEDGGYFCAQDAQSEGKEGKFYCWTLAELKDLLDYAELAAVEKHFGITRKGNFYDYSDPEALKNQNILSLVNGFYKGGDKILDQAIVKMKQARSKRDPPMTDKKVLSSWNGMMIPAMMRAGILLDEPRYVKSANESYEFVYKVLWDQKTKRLTHRYFNTKHSNGAGITKDVSQQSESYLQMLRAARLMYEYTLDDKALAWAIELADQSVELFYDKKQGGFYSSPERDDVIIRLKGDYDGAIPTASSTAVLEFLKLHEITGVEGYLQIAEQTLKSHKEIATHPTSLSYMLAGVDYYYGAKQRLIVAAAKEGDVPKIVSTVHRKIKWLPHLTIMGNTGKVEAFNLGLKPVNEKTAYYFCEGKSCQLPQTDLSEMEGVNK